MEFVQKRDGSIVEFDRAKIMSVISRGADSVIFESKDKVSKDEPVGAAIPVQALSGQVCDYLELLETDPVNVETVSDYVEKVLMEEGYSRIAKNFILYRYKRTQLRERKERSGVIDDIKLSLNAIRILESRYLLRDSEGSVIETPRQMFERVAKHVSRAERSFPKGNEAKYYQEFLDLLISRDFLPNSPMFLNSGKRDGLLSSICALPIEDSTEGLFSTLKSAAIIHKRGGGTGFSFSSLRPRRDSIKGKPGVASGPLAFLKLFDRATSLIKQGQVRPGGNMGILRVDHPDIIDFITIKDDKETVNNYNLSVGITDAFMRSLKRGTEYTLYNPRTKEAAGSLNAKRIMDLISLMAWKNGDPGIVFIDRMNNVRNNPVPSLGRNETTSPCGEYPMQNYEAVILGSINLSQHVHVSLVDSSNRWDVDWEKLRSTARLAVRFLDDATQMNSFPLRKSREIVHGNRKIGIGIMGFADLLIRLGYSYGSDDGRKIASKIMKFIDSEARAASRELANVRGVFLNHHISIYAAKGEEGKLRNACLTSISPTGTISHIAGCSPSIEPLYGVSFLRRTAQFEFLEVNPLFEEIARKRGFYSDEIFRKIAGKVSIQDIKEIPKDVRHLFLTAMDLSPDDHVKMQAAFQKHVDNAISKTVNFPHHATVDDIQRVFMLAYDLGCKGITVYRDGSLDNQVLNGY
ncbi:adenosylcobalamin-dependent ribonucleoside-diphosphate reductase [archaeon]|nr:adenosylcobalamin-dependent ribonucleoside-diphosphate reductase [archaeon]MBT6697514.1 adenosylcobalamin-dependent ribonucleoside-diphosphate reductase [archaeon]